jgi:hypothetical protein
VAGFKFVVSATPTQSSGTASAENLQKAVRALVIKDGTGRQYFNGSFASNRIQDALERGWLSAPEPDAAATTEAVNFERVFLLGPDGFSDPADFVQPAALFRGGSITFSYGALTDVTATTTALTLTIQTFAICQLHDEVILGAMVDRFESLLTNGQVLGTEGLYTEVGFCNSSLFDAITAGDFANVTTVVNGFTRDSIHVADLERMYHADKQVNSLTPIHGEPRAATDDNPKVAAATALAAASANISPIIWSPKGAKISKLIYAAQPNVVFKWSGSQASAYVLATRIVPRTAADVGKAESLVKAGLSVGFRNMDARTLSKESYTGPRKAYMPLKVKVG